MDPLTIAALGTQALSGIAQTVTGIFQSGKANKMARKNPRPKYNIQKPIYDNQAIAESRAGQGISDAAMQAYTTFNDRSLSLGIDSILRGGGSVNNIADIYDTAQTGLSKLALIDEEVRAKNIRDVITQNNIMASELDKEWQVNVFAPYADTAQAAAALKGQGSDNIWKGINSFGSAISNAAMANKYGSEANNVFTSNTRPPAAQQTNSNQSSSRNTGSGMGGLDPILIDGVWYDPLTMQPI